MPSLAWLSHFLSFVLVATGREPKKPCKKSRRLTIDHPAAGSSVASNLLLTHSKIKE
jgi:hypothetical protein